MSSLFQISERCHAGLILMSALAALPVRDTDRRVSLHEVAVANHVSQGYLEEIAGSLKQAGLIEGRKGAGGGYRLTRAPGEITAEDIITAIEGPVRLVGCQQNPGACPVESSCTSKSLWKLLQTRVSQTLSTTSLQDVLEQSRTTVCQN